MLSVTNSMSEIIIEKLLEQRDFYLSTLKQLDFQRAMDPTDNEIKEIEKLNKKLHICHLKIIPRLQ